MALALVIISIGSCLYSLMRPFHRNNVYHTAKYLGKVSKILGLEVEIRVPESLKKAGPVVYICNHQNSYDIFTISGSVRPGTVSIGKKSLKWIPFFGQMYWLTGNILIDRVNTSKAINTISTTADKIREKRLSVWLFPEGTRSNGRGLLPFKTGAFRTAIQAGVPIVPICASNQHGNIKLNRWHNGKVIIEFLAPVYADDDSREGIRSTADHVHAVMKEKIAELSAEAASADKSL